MTLWSSSDEEHRLELSTSLKGSWLYSRYPVSSLAAVMLPVSERDSALAFWRLRLMFAGRHGSRITSEIAYENRIRDVVNGAWQVAGSSGVLPSEASAPYRISQLDEPVTVRSNVFSHRHELDRAYVAVHSPHGDYTVGRQAIGLGRGVLFGAVDIFAPFSPLEVDREWRRGIDAVHAEYDLSEACSIGLIGAFGDTSADSAYLARIRGYRGDYDAELVFGRRCRDYLYGMTVSAVVADAELHCEVAAFDTPGTEALEGGLFGSDRYVGKIVVGGSYTFDLGSDVGGGLYTLLEYHFSGFGTQRIEQVAQRLLDPAYRTRYLRGDSQITGQEAVALQMSLGIDPERTAGLLIMSSPNDGSGIVSPSLSWNYTDNVTLVATVYFPFGYEPAAGVTMSEYGAAPESFFLQIRMYH